MSDGDAAVRHAIRAGVTLAGPVRPKTITFSWRHERMPSMDTLAVIGVVLGIWQAVAGFTTPYALPSPVETAVALVKALRNADAAGQTATTVFEILTGFALGATPATALPFVFRRVSVVGEVLEPFMMAGYGAPKLAFAPLIVLWFGIGAWPIILLVSLTVFFSVYASVTAGLRKVDPKLLQIVRLLGASELRLERDVVLPAAVPFIFSGYRIALPYAAATAVVAEMMSANRGLGYLLTLSSANFDASSVLATIILICAVVSALTLMLAAAERSCLRWKRQQAVQ